MEKGEREASAFFSTSHSCVFLQPGKYINARAFLSGNKGTKLDWGSKEWEGGLRKFERERLRAAGSFLFLNEIPACVGNRYRKKTDQQVNGEAEIPKEISAHLNLLVKNVKKKEKVKDTQVDRRALGPAGLCKDKSPSCSKAAWHLSPFKGKRRETSSLEEELPWDCKSQV